MLSGTFNEHWTDEDGHPAGGVSSGRGLAVSWQNGPLGRDGDRIEPNGAFVEDVIDVARKRIEFYEASRFACAENKAALVHLEAALEALDLRTKSREAREVEGTHTV